MEIQPKKPWKHVKHTHTAPEPPLLYPGSGYSALVLTVCIALAVILVMLSGCQKLSFGF